MKKVGCISVESLPSQNCSRIQSPLTKAIAASSDGEHIVVVYADGKVRRYLADNGFDKGSVGGMNVASCNISGGIIILGYRDGNYRRYDARSGADKGSA